jgi:acetyl esterase/lipase
MNLPARAVSFADLAAVEPAKIPYAEGPSDARWLDVFSPDADRTKLRPAILLIHGGAWVGGDPTVFHPHAAYFAQRGLVAISVGYRLATPQGGSLATCVEDVRAALAYVRANAKTLGVDPTRIAVLGDSAGGHLAGVLATDPDPGVAAAILANPIVDLQDGDWMKFVIAGRALERGAPPEALVPTEAQKAQARALSPLFAVHPGVPPTLLLHGTADHVVRPEQSERFQAAMKEAGNPCTLRLLEGARHAFLVPRYTAPEPLVVGTLREVDEFLAGLGFLAGPPTLEPSNPPLWQPR